MERTISIINSGEQSHHTIWDIRIVEETLVHLKYRSSNTEKSKFYDLVIFLIGAISKIIATLVTYPYTLIRTKQHVDKTKKATIYETFINEVQKNGLGGLYTGMKAKIVQSVLNSALMLMIYERTHLTLLRLLKNSGK